jgi:hypothetical protein
VGFNGLFGTSLVGVGDKDVMFFSCFFNRLTGISDIVSSTPMRINQRNFWYSVIFYLLFVIKR